MLTLHDSTQLTKTIAKWVGIGLAGILGIVLLIRGGGFIMKTFFPEPTAPPETRFGKLPAIIFPGSASQDKLSFQLDTVTGDLGSYPDRVKVYKTVTPVPNLLDLRNTRAAAAESSFSENETYITDTEYSWRETKRSDKKLTVNIVSRDFSIASNFLTYPDLAPESTVNQEAAIGSVTTFLENLELYPLDLEPTKTTTQLLSLQGTTVFAATSLSTAQLLRIDLFQKDLDKIPITYPHPPNSTMHFLMGGKASDEILEASFTHQTLSNESSTYPIINVDSAYEILKANQAYIASYFGTDNNISIKEVYLAYYMSDEKQDFIMPVYVFSGDDGFYAYVPAIPQDWIR